MSRSCASKRANSTKNSNRLEIQQFFPDSLDLVDPSFDFVTEERSLERVRQRDDRYAHEIFNSPPFDGLLVSKGIVDGWDSSSRYSMAQRQRLSRVGVREFFRVDGPEFRQMLIMGDCGAFSYAKEKLPPFSAEEVVDFYQELGFDLGVSPDHIPFGYNAAYDEGYPGVLEPPEDLVNRRQITLDLAEEFLEEVRSRGRPFTPMAVAHGWSPNSYAESLRELQSMGYRRIALGGLVPLKMHDLREVVKSAGAVRRKDVKLHLLGVMRLDMYRDWAASGVTSFDTTSPLRQAFLDDRDNYYLPESAIPAIRVPQVEKNNTLKRKISKGEVDSTKVRQQERSCMRALQAYDKGDASLEEAFGLLVEYNSTCGLGDSYLSDYRSALETRPWDDCRCDVCRAIGINVVIFRGAERNRRRGFHNLYVFRRRFEAAAGKKRGRGK
jgi:hypothetical protein